MNARTEQRSNPLHFWTRDLGKMFMMIGIAMGLIYWINQFTLHNLTIYAIYPWAMLSGFCGIALFGGFFVLKLVGLTK